MTKLKTLENQLRSLQGITRGEWVRVQGDYVTNAFEGIYKELGDDRASYVPVDTYQVSATKQDGRWFVFAEEHETQELIRMGEQPSDGFRTLAEAKSAAEAFGAWFESVSLEAAAA